MTDLSYFRSQCLRIAQFNVENLFVFLDVFQRETLHGDGDPRKMTRQELDKARAMLQGMSESQWQKLSTSILDNKPLAKVRQLARAIRDIDPDILMLCEVGGLESLRNFSLYFLDDEYAPYLLEGNSDRGIDIGFLVHRRLPFRYDLLSHKNRSIDLLYPHEKQSIETGYGMFAGGDLKSHKFSRDVLELRVYEDRGDRPEFICLLVHLKSQLDLEGIDPRGRDRRRAELEKLVQIYNEIRADFSGVVPILLGGDFNGTAALPRPDPEFQALHSHTMLRDCLDIAGTPPDERFTYMQIYDHRPPVLRQLDYLFVPVELAARVSRTETRVFRFNDEYGMRMLLPRNLNEKRLLPSDHYPVVLTLEPEAEPPLDPEARRNSAKSMTGR